MKLFRQLAVLSLVMSASNFACGAEKPSDIVGIKLGMTADQVRASLKAHDPNMKIIDYASWKAAPGVPASLAKIRGCGTPMPGGVGPYDICKDMIDISFGHVSKKALFIKRQVRFDSNTMLVKNVNDSIFAKYGTPTYKSNESFSFLWAYTPEGSPINNTECAISDMNLPFPDYRAHCGNVFSASVRPGAGGFALEMWTNLYQSKLFFDEQAAFNNAVNADRADKEKAAKENKVKL